MLPLARRPLNSPRPIRERVFRGRLRPEGHASRAAVVQRCTGPRPEDPIRRQQPSVDAQPAWILREMPCPCVM
jgi:hypothetical protein